MERPVFIWSSGWRTGSTLLQRLLSSHKDILICEENHSLLDPLARAREVVVGLQKFGRKQVDDYRKHGSTAWVAVMSPPVEQFDEGLRRRLETYYREPPREFGKSRWGFKEVRHGVEAAKILHHLYPESRFLFLLRHPTDCLASARATCVPPLKPGDVADAGGTRAFLENRARIAESVLHPAGVPSLTVYYERLVQDPAAVIGEVAAFLGVAPGDLDPGVLDVRRRGWLGLPPRPNREDRHWLESGWLWKADGKHGYEPKDVAPIPEAPPRPHPARETGGPS